MQKSLHRPWNSSRAALCCRCRNCKVLGTTSFGVFVEVLPGVKGMVHVSQLDTARSNVEDYSEGMTIDVKVIDVSFCTPFLHAHSCVLGTMRILGG